MMGKGLARQLGRCETASSSSSSSSSSAAAPAFCSDGPLYNKVRAAYTKLWDIIEANSAVLGLEVWSWRFGEAGYEVVPLGEVTSTESNVRQLWSLTFLAVHREVFGGGGNATSSAGPAQQTASMAAEVEVTWGAMAWVLVAAGLLLW